MIPAGNYRNRYLSDLRRKHRRGLATGRQFDLPPTDWVRCSLRRVKCQRRANHHLLQGKFWPGNTRLVASISMQFEAGGQPPKGTDSPFPKVEFPENVPSDPATKTWFAYGYREGIPRMLDLWDRHGVKVTVAHGWRGGEKASRSGEGDCRSGSRSSRARSALEFAVLRLAER